MLQVYKKGGEELFADELIIGSVRAQADHLKAILCQMETDERWKEQRAYYASQMREIENKLKKIRKAAFEHIN
ncbi:MAG: hypothetical protein NC938_05355 [Candidatus Omnitrophica bacterium]|nr:hypothetical protein [Candidatus Omnitrophota bacterium]MCM8791108.1 hypothetical protein [Candidatus Omnitrophota bacterium]